jgi:hypothetical protein
MSIRAVACLLLVLCFSACGDDDAAVDAAPPTIDAHVITPDAPVTTPDAAVAAPDAAVATVDAAVVTPDAAPTGCDPVLQTGCAPGQACDLVADVFACTTAGTQPDFHVCTPGACQAGFTCRGTVFDDQRCARFCTPGTPDPCGEGAACTSQRVTADGQTYFMCNQTSECSPIWQDCADTSTACYVGPAGAFCLKPGARQRPPGSPCTTPPQCQSGSTCLQDRCFRQCDAGDDQSCGPRGSCAPLFELGAQSIGLCFP